MSNTKISLATVAGGAAIERFDEALEEVIENIVDPNTDITKKRQIKLTLDVVPGKNDRGKAIYELTVEAKLAPPTAIGNIMHVGIDKGCYVAYDGHVEQGQFDFEENVEDVILKNVKES